MARQQERRWEPLTVEIGGKAVEGRWAAERGVVTVEYAMRSSSTHSTGPVADKMVARSILRDLYEGVLKNP